MVFGRGRRRARQREDAAERRATEVDPGAMAITVDDDIHLWSRIVDRRDGEDGETVVVPCCGNFQDFEPLEIEGRRVVYYDVRNRGRSDAVDDLARLGFVEEVTDLAAVCDQLDLGAVSVLAWSYLTGVAAQFALVHPARIERLVLASGIPARSGIPPAGIPEPPPHVLAQLDQLQAEGVPDTDPHRWCEEWRRAYVPMRMGIPAAFERLSSPCEMPNEHPRRIAIAMVCVFAGLSHYDWRPDLRAIDAPTLIVHGTADADPVELAEEWLGALPDARLLVLQGVGQYPWVEAPDNFFHTVNRFLRGEPV